MASYVAAIFTSRVSWSAAAVCGLDFDSLCLTLYLGIPQLAQAPRPTIAAATRSRSVAKHGLIDVRLSDPEKLLHAPKVVLKFEKGNGRIAHLLGGPELYRLCPSSCSANVSYA